ncbi:PEP-CTERM sorting domain-containing protein [Anaerohalosphaera lusitana]|nr:PEP-CTERM sorting domain-containing protein [Anaerohalosphaera lusitana]
MLLVLCACAAGVNAGTVAYWRFEDGVPGEQVQHGADPAQFSADISDVSGNGNHLSVWETQGGGSFGYRADVPYSTVPGTGAANDLSVKNTGGFPGMFTQTGSQISTMAPGTFTIEASFKIENGNYRTIIGRDSYGTVSDNSALAALYLQATPDNALAIKYSDVSGFWHEAVSENAIFESFDFGSDPTGSNVPWYSVSAVSDGSTLSLYLREAGAGVWDLIAETDIAASGSEDTALTAGAGDGGDWDAGNWTVARGLYDGWHGDRAWGFVDEVRISDEALSQSEFLVPEPATLALMGLGYMTLLRRRK